MGVEPSRRALLLRVAAGFGAAALTVTLPAAAARRATRAAVGAAALQLKAGDLVFRTGFSAESMAVRSVSRGESFSHVGVALETSVGWHVVHAAPAEHGRASGVSRLPWNDYAFAEDVEAIAVFRVAGLGEAERTRLAAAAAAFVGRRFNSSFELDDQAGVYCTQVALASCAAVDPSITAWVKPTPVSLLPDPVYLPVSLLNWPRLVEVTRA